MDSERKELNTEDAQVLDSTPAKSTRSSTWGRSAPLYDKEDLEILLRNNRRNNSKKGRRDLSSSANDHHTTVDTETEQTVPDRDSEATSSSAESSDENESSQISDTDTQELYYRRIGYFPSFDEETLSLIETVLADLQLGMAILNSNRGLTNGLKYNRNVSLDPTIGEDTFIAEINNAPSYLPKESMASTRDQELQNELWRHDHRRCTRRNEALFQRTLMMAMIDRSRFFWNRVTNCPNRYDFSVETAWNCMPMPTRALLKGEYLDPRPKPDLCVSFRIDELIPPHLMGRMPRATQCLIQCEGTDMGQGDRAFPFLTVEAKRSFLSPDDPIALLQSLNSASQALHNIYEFFREAESEAVFFNKVRFFSAAAMSKGVVIRIHRPVLIPSDGDARILPSYPLAFEYEEFARFEGKEYGRQKVVDVFERIIWSYGSILFDELKKAAGIVAEKFKNNPTLTAKRDHAYYRHGQTELRYPRTNSKAPSQADTTSFVGNSAATSRIYDSFGLDETQNQQDHMPSSPSKRRRFD